jgi:hypothetical protein
VQTILASDAAGWGRPENPTKVYLVTLTYPGQDGREFIPHDGRVAQAQRAKFLKAWRRAFDAYRCIWKLEFQARSGEWAHDWQRCAPHWTIWIEAPSSRLADVREWAAAAWWRIVGSGAETHLSAGTKVQPWRGPIASYALKYMRKGRDKEYQHRVPNGYVNVGRWWALVGLRVRWIEVALSEREFFRVRRLVRKSMEQRRKGRRQVRFRGRYAGMWMWVRDHPAKPRELIDAFMRGAALNAEQSNDGRQR